MSTRAGFTILLAVLLIINLFLFAICSPLPIWFENDLTTSNIITRRDQSKQRAEQSIFCQPFFHTWNCSQHISCVAMWPIKKVFWLRWLSHYVYSDVNVHPKCGWCLGGDTGKIKDVEEYNIYTICFNYCYSYAPVKLYSLVFFFRNKDSRCSSESFGHCGEGFDRWQEATGSVTELREYKSQCHIRDKRRACTPDLVIHKPT